MTISMYRVRHSRRGLRWGEALDDGEGGASKLLAGFFRARSTKRCLASGSRPGSSAGSCAAAPTRCTG